MSCTKNGVTISGDENNKLLNSVEFVSKSDTVKETLCAGYINTPEFRQYLKENTGIDKPLDVHVNVFRGLLNSYYKAKNVSVNNDISRKMAESIGNFSSATALSLAKTHTSDLVLDEYYEDLSKNKEDRRSTKAIIKDVTDKLNKTFNDSIAFPLIKVNIESNNIFIKELAEAARDANIKSNNLIKEYNALLDKLESFDENDDANDTIIDQINSKLDAMDIEIVKLNNNKYIAFYNLVQEVGNIKQKNYANLIAKVRGDANNWFSNIFPEIEFADDSIDEMSKSWDKNDKSDFNQYISSDVKRYFDRLYKLNTVVSPGDPYDYDTNNELGVPITMKSSYIIAQIINTKSFSSVTDLINTIDKLSKRVKDLQGLSKLVNDMRSDRVFANKVFVALAHPKITKAMATITNKGSIEFKQSNRNIDPFSYMLFDLINQIKFTMKQAYDIRDIDDTQKFINNLIRIKDNGINDTMRKEADSHIINILNKYFPKLNKNDIIDYLYNNTGNIIDTYINMLQNLNSIHNDVAKSIDQQNKIRIAYNVKYAAWRQSNDRSAKPIYDNSAIDNNALASSLISLSEKLIEFVPVKNELNSSNAESNLSSDIADNNRISNIINQIQYGNAKDSFAGLNKLKAFITKSSQYDYSTIFYGVKDKNGKIIYPGIFKREDNGSVTINPDAKSIISYTMFNGAKTDNNSKSVLYSSMSKGDYFMTQLIAFYSPIEYFKKTNNNVKLGGFFLRTPSDAPKNYVLQLPTLSSSLMFKVDESNKTYYINKVLDNITSIHNFDNKGVLGEKEDSLPIVLKSNNYITSLEAYDILSNPIENRNYNNTYTIYDKSTNKVLIPLSIKLNETNIVTIWLEGDKVLGVNNIAENIKVKQIISATINTLPEAVINEIKDTIVEEGIDNGSIIRNANMDNPICRALLTNLYGELNNYINNLNNVFKRTTGKGWSSIDDTNNLIDVYQHDGISIVDKNGKLSGRVFSFIKLFETNEYNANNELEDALSLYRGDKKNNIKSLFAKTTNDNLRLNTSRKDLIVIKDGKISLNITPETNALLETIVTNWAVNYSKEVRDRTKQYKTIINNRFNASQIEEVMFNNAIVEMAFDDIFEGDAKFYKNTKTFLKRSKECQSGGNDYANQDVNDDMGGPIHNIVDSNNWNIPINIKGVPNIIPIRGTTSIQLSDRNARNGFRAVTISNTVRGSNNVNAIYNELVAINKETLGEKEAIRVAKEIAKGFGLQNDNGTIDATKVNDAQSYITLEEFIQRRWADGTIGEYEDLIRQLTDDTIITDINLKDVNARIQVQKNFYYDIQFDANTNSYYPRNIKNAEFVLIPKLLPEGSSLRRLYDIMLRNDIGQVNTEEADKAAKRTVLTFWDNDGNVNENFEKDLNGVGAPISQGVNDLIFAEGYNDAAVENYYYRNLYKQQTIVDHMSDKTNKAGIQIMKKMIDNSNNSNQNVKDNVDKFFKSYCANIKEDFNLLLDRLGWEIKDGSLKNKIGDNTSLNFIEFWDKARVEARRLNMDSNFIEYLTPDIFGNPTMKNYMNNVSAKLESIAQSIFNSSITRQKLPGWHAVQVTNIGYDKDLKYHPEVKNEDGTIKNEAYIEVRLPRWSKLIPKNYDINKLSEEGLDIQLGYRIPTEGKQSVSVIKVVELLDETQGSTIIVPDEWVTQTSSDFDVDTVYGICYEIYKDYDGVIRKINPDMELDEDSTKRRYIKYVNNNLKKRVNRNAISDEFVKDEISKLYDSIIGLDNKSNKSKAFSDLKEQENAAYKTLPKDLKLQIIRYNQNSDEVFEDKALANATMIKTYGDESIDNNIKQNCFECADLLYAIADLINNGKEYYANNLIKFRSAKKETIEKIIEQAKDDYFNKVSKVAKEANIESFETFSNRTIVEQQSRKARNNMILDSMIAIMNDPSSREENYSRSNFDDLASAMKENDSLRGANKTTTSTYNPLDQIDFMENATRGARLKAVSVVRDNFVSVCNKIQPILSYEHHIRIEYDLNEYDIDTLISAYGKDVTINEDSGTAIVKHDKLGWSNNNRNVKGKLITTYSSQTTAHMFDAVKEGFIFNENDYAFGTFKTLIDVGTDYNTAISFLMQPGITEIVNAYNESKSIYINNYTNPINEAIKNIAIKLGITVNGEPIDVYTRMPDVIDSINANTKLTIAFSELFNADYTNGISFMKQQYVLNKTSLQKRLSESELSNNPELSIIEKEYRNAAYDLVMISVFNKIHNTTNNISELVNCSNPDKFGAKQTIRATRKTINNIKEYSKNDIDNTIGKTLLVDGKPMLNSIYPNVNEGDVDIENSKYPYLAAFLQYASIPSVAANSQLFYTESDAYNSVVDIAQDFIGRELSDIEYKEYKEYMVANVYNSTKGLTTPMTVNEFGYIVENIDLISEQTENNTFYWNAERARLFGYDTTESSSLKIKNINNPTNEEIAKYNKLTPAQKCIFIQQNFKDGAGIFGSLNVNGFHQQELKEKGFSSATIKYNDQIENAEEVLLAFKESFYNKNKLVRLAAIDLIKYSFIVEGFKFKKGSISKLITNIALTSNIEEKGTGFMDAIDKMFITYVNPNSGKTMDFIEKFVRSHSDIIKEIKVPKVSKSKQGSTINASFAKYMQSEGMLYIPNVKSSENILSFIGISNDDNMRYIKLTRSIDKEATVTTLYRIEKTDNGIYFLPLNLLEHSETSDYSVNKNNNLYKAVDYYIKIADAASEKSISVNDLKRDDSLWKEIVKTQGDFTIKPHKDNNIIEAMENINMLQSLTSQGTEYQKLEVNRFIKDIADYVSSPVEESTDSILIRNDSFSIANTIPKGITVIQSIPIENVNTLVKIERVDMSANFKKVLNNPSKGDMSKILPKEQLALKNAIEAGAKFPTLYEITPISEEEQNRKYAITSIIEEGFDTVIEDDKTDNVAKAIVSEITNRARRENTSNANKFKKVLDINNIDTDSYESIHDNKTSIYVAAAKYYETRSAELRKSIDEFETSDGQTYSINDPKLYEFLVSHPKDYDKLNKLLLDAKTFGDQFYEIFNLNIEGEDTETSKAISDIRRHLNSVRNSSKLAKAMELTFNSYMANAYSTNPLIRNGILQLRTQFGDTDWFDLQFSDIGELSNTQVQTVVKSVYTTINAGKLNAVTESNKFIEEYDTIMNESGEFNLDHVFTKDGRLTRAYTDDFLKHKEEYRNRVNNAKKSYGEDSIQYHKAKTEWNEWKALNLEQNIIADYYKSMNALTNGVLARAGNEYVEYIKLSKLISADTRSNSLLTDEERRIRKDLRAKRSALLSEIDASGNLKSEEKLYAISQLKQFIKNKSELNKKYFDTTEDSDKRSMLNTYVKFIKEYEDKHPYETLDNRLENEHYRTAYDWIQSNYTYKLTPEAQSIISKAYAVLKDRDNTNSKEIKNLLDSANAFDSYGNIDPRKLNEAQIAMIKNLTQSKYYNEYDSGAGESFLIKDIPKVPIMLNSVHRANRAPDEAAQNPKRLQTIREINILLEHGLDKTGRLRTKLLFDNLTEDELIKLAELYKVLGSIKSNRKGGDKDNYIAGIKYAENNSAFIEELNTAERDLTKSQFKLWRNIFAATDSKYNPILSEENTLSPNHNIYGYTFSVEEDMIDVEKTEARDIIENALNFVPTEYYYAAMKTAVDEGRYNEWYAANHTFNPFIHKFEPLRVWTRMEISQNSKLKGEFEYMPSNENVERTVKDEYKNTNKKDYSMNYNTKTGNYNNTTNLSNKEQKMIEFLQNTINAHAISHGMKNFAKEGYIPRRANHPTDTKYYAEQAAGAVGISTGRTGETKWNEDIDYTHDFDADFDMMSLIKGKGYRNLIPLPINDPLKTSEQNEEYLNEIKEENKAIKASNLAIDNALMDKDYRSVFQDFVSQSTIYEARQRAKNTIYLLLEDLKDNKAYMSNRYSGNLKVNKNMSTSDKTVYQTIDQEHTYDIVQNWMRRIAFNEFKKESKFSKFADLAQNMTSAKYMIFNVTGGFANVFTGSANISGEILAREYFNASEFTKAQARYASNSLTMLADMYSPTTNNLAVGLIKRFNVVDLDAYTERRPNEMASEYVKRVRDSLYALQSGGEHYMQNTALFAMLDSHRVFEDFDGTTRVGSLANYTWKMEYNTMNELIANNEALRLKYKSFIKSIKENLNELRKYSTFKRDFNEEFLRDIGDKDLINSYITARNISINKAKKDFAAFPKMDSQFELKNGIVDLKADAIVTNEMVAEFKQKVVSVNKRIHGVYDKEGAARIEREWWGSLVMMYHKHIYPGIMKRFRTNGHYNEIRSSIERGSYISTASLLTTEFRNINKNIKSEHQDTNDTDIILRATQSVIKAAIDTIINLKLNYEMMPDWERANVRRSLGDLLGVAAAFAMALIVHLGSDDDDIKDSEFLSTLIYLADRCNSESAMYTPWGVITEAKTLWSSPIAASNGPEDLLKTLGIVGNMVFNDSYNPYYSTGQYKGEHKLKVILGRNIPGHRVVERLKHMSKNNKYYRLGENSININSAKNLADYINPDHD